MHEALAGKVCRILFLKIYKIVNIFQRFHALDFVVWSNFYQSQKMEQSVQQPKAKKANEWSNYNYQNYKTALVEASKVSKIAIWLFEPRDPWSSLIL